MILFVVAGVAVGVIIAYLVISLVLPDIVRKSQEQLVLMNDQKLGAVRGDISTDLDNKKAAIEDIAKRIREELEKNQDKLEAAERERIGSFHELAQELGNQRKITQELSVTTESLKKVLSNNQLRGQFGEQVAEDLLKMTGFVKGVDYEFNKEQEGSETRPDFTIFLPNKVKINVDSKFPYQNLQRMTETQDSNAKKEHLKMFERDIREKIKQVTSRNYINPEDNTVDFVIMFIPNEMIFSFIYDKMNDVWLEALKQKVVLAGPFSFTAILRMVRQAYENFRYQKNVQKIIGYIKMFEVEFNKYNDEFVKIGDRINSLNDQYNKVNTTRTHQLLKTIDKVKLEEGSTEEVYIKSPPRKILGLSQS
jgi:DNA recombination protein RmuC